MKIKKTSFFKKKTETAEQKEQREQLEKIKQLQRINKELLELSMNSIKNQHK